jgi:hypothetical protein
MPAAAQRTVAAWIVEADIFIKRLLLNDGEVSAATRLGARM